jgi:hypothetical protein
MNSQPHEIETKKSNYLCILIMLGLPRLYETHSSLSKISIISVHVFTCLKLINYKFDKLREVKLQPFAILSQHTVTCNQFGAVPILNKWHESRNSVNNISCWLNQLTDSATLIIQFWNAYGRCKRHFLSCCELFIHHDWADEVDTAQYNTCDRNHDLWGVVLEPFNAVNLEVDLNKNS